MHPYKNMPLTDVTQYCTHHNITEKDTNARKTGRLDKLARFTGHSTGDIVEALAQGIYSFGRDLVPNKVQGPLPTHQKVVIRDNYTDVRQAKPLSVYMNTSYQNIRLAQRGDFKESKAPRDRPAPGTRVLTYTEKLEIHRDHKLTPTAEVARLYGTRYQYAQRAQLGDFTRKTTRHTVSITEEQALDLGIPPHVRKISYVD